MIHIVARKNTQKKIKLLLPNVAVLGDRYEDILKMVQAYTSLNVSLYFISEQILIGQEIPNSFPIISEICFQLYKSILSLKNKNIVANIRKSGRTPGRRFGSKNCESILNGNGEEIFALKAQGMTNLQIAAHIGCGTTSLYKFLRKHRENVHA